MLRVVDNEGEDLNKTNVNKTGLTRPISEEEESYGQQDDQNDQDDIDYLVDEFQHRSQGILNNFDQLYKSHIMTKAQLRRVTYENDKLKEELTELYRKNGQKREMPNYELPTIRLGRSQVM